MNIAELKLIVLLSILTLGGVYLILNHIEKQRRLRDMDDPFNTGKPSFQK